MKILFSSFTFEDIGVAMVTNINFDFLEHFSFITLDPSCDRHFAIGDHFNCTILLFRK